VRVKRGQRRPRKGKRNERDPAQCRLANARRAEITGIDSKGRCAKEVQALFLIAGA